MAPSKKKKLKSNPARGFATTSIASKPRTDLDVPTRPVENQAVASISSPTVKLVGVAEDTDRKGANEDAAVEALSPEAYSEHLEDSHRQLMLEQYGEKINRDVKRHSNRLRTERRLLQSSVDYVSLIPWLPTDLLLLVKDQLNITYTETFKNLQYSQTDSDDDEFLIRICTIYRTLVELGIEEHQARAALAHVVHISQLQIGSPSPMGKNPDLWGLDESFDWFALHEVPDTYPANVSSAVTGKVEVGERSTASPTGKDRLPSPQRERAKTPSPTRTEVPRDLETVDQEDTTIQSETVRSPRTNLNASDGCSHLVLSDSASESDDPAAITSRYLRLLQKLNRIDVKLANVTYRNLTQKSSKRVRLADNYHPDASRILRRIATIEADILFDRFDAATKWVELRNNEAREVAERKRYRLDASIEAQDVPKYIPPEELQPGPAVSKDNADDVIDDLSDFFLHIPNNTVNSNEKAQVDDRSLDEADIVVRDFGKQSGIRPRRILEETCKARDKSVKISFKLVSVSCFAYRYECSVEWCQHQQETNIIPVEHVSVLGDHKRVNVKMIDLAAPDQAQSEGYVAILTLFILFSRSSQDEKVYLRLPSLWRDLWFEFARLAQDHQDMAGRELLRSLQNLMNENRRPSDRIPKPSDSNADQNTVRTENISCTEKVIGEPSIQNDSEREELQSVANRQVWEMCKSKTAYKTMEAGRQALPIYKFKNNVVDAIVRNQVVIICGETGCGKSTQVPSFILEHELRHGRQCKIYCTEPRRISAISLARRVSEELGERKEDLGTAGSLVGYSIRLESRMTSQTRLIYATTGVVMRILERSKDLGDITHLVIDEVHERSIDSDFLLIVLRKLMKVRPRLRIILMSATVNATRFSEYLSAAPILNVPGRTYPVAVKYLEDAIEATGFQLKDRSGDPENPSDSDSLSNSLPANKTKQALLDSLGEYSQNTRNVVVSMNESKVPYNLIVKLLRTIATKPEYRDYSKAILVFLPGMAEIRKIHDLIESETSLSSKWKIHSLHSSIATEEQERAFLIPPRGMRKIVLATNIAETGVTIPDVTCVIDVGKHKEMRFDEKRQLSRLTEFFISRANAKQRRGRAGRVQEGLCFHLFTKHRHDKLFAEEQTPEILRLSLQDLVLRVKVCKLGGIEETLSEALDPPASKNVRSAIEALVDVKALTASEDLTHLGRRLASLPLDVFLGKLVLLGTIFGCLDGALTTAAILSSKSPFVASIHQKSQADQAKLSFKKGDSDLITTYNAVLAYRRMSSEPRHTFLYWSQRNFLSLQILSSIEDLKAQICTTLMDSGFLGKERSYSRSVQQQIITKYDWNAGNDLILNSVIAWSFYPKLLRRNGGAWHNVATNQIVELNPASVHRPKTKARWLSFYNIMHSRYRSYNAQELSPVDDLTIALFCGDADFRMYAKAMIIDGNRMRFRVDDWNQLLIIKALRTQLKAITDDAFRKPGRALSVTQTAWFEIWQKMFWHMHQLRENRRRKVEE